MSNIIKVLRSTTASARPTGRAFGEMYWNDKDRTFGVIDFEGEPIDIAIGLPPSNDKIYGIKRSSNGLSSYEEVSPLISYDTLELHVSTTGVENPVNPDTDPSATFDNLSSLLLWVSNNVAAANTLNVYFAAGTYNDPGTHLSFPAVYTLNIIGDSSDTTTVNVPGQIQSNAASTEFSTITLAIDGILLGVSACLNASGDVVCKDDVVLSRTGQGTLIGAAGLLRVVNGATAEFSGESASTRKLLEAIDGITLVGSSTVMVNNSSANNGIVDLVNSRFQIGTQATFEVSSGNGEINMIGATVYKESGPAGTPTLTNVLFNYDLAAVEEPPADGTYYARVRASGTHDKGTWHQPSGIYVVDTPPADGTGNPNDIYFVVP